MDRQTHLLLRERFTQTKAMKTMTAASTPTPTTAPTITATEELLPEVCVLVDGTSLTLIRNKT